MVNDGTTTLTNSTFASNQAIGSSGGPGEAGAIANCFSAASATLTVTNTTFFGNQAVNGST